MFIAPRFRKRGLTHHLIAGVLKDLMRRGVTRVQGFPRRGQRLPDEDAWTGPEAVFLAAGFVVEREGSQGPIFSKRLTTYRRMEGVV